MRKVEAEKVGIWRIGRVKTGERVKKNDSWPGSIGWGNRTSSSDSLNPTQQGI